MSLCDRAKLISTNDLSRQNISFINISRFFVNLLPPQHPCDRKRIKRILILLKDLPANSSSIWHDSQHRIRKLATNDFNLLRATNPVRSGGSNDEHIRTIPFKPAAQSSDERF